MPLSFSRTSSLPRTRSRANEVGWTPPSAACRLGGYDRMWAARSVLRSRRDLPSPDCVVWCVLVVVGASLEFRSIAARSAIATIALTTGRYTRERCGRLMPIARAIAAMGSPRAYRSRNSRFFAGRAGSDASTASQSKSGGQGPSRADAADSAAVRRRPRRRGWPAATRAGARGRPDDGGRRRPAGPTGPETDGRGARTCG